MIRASLKIEVEIETEPTAKESVIPDAAGTSVIVEKSDENQAYSAAGADDSPRT